ncbi:jg10257, partial [Pararge aegeria aegeria]
GKEVACNITKLPCGSVVFEDVSPEIMRGQVLKPLERGNMVRVAQNDPLPGRIRYRAADHSEVEVSACRVSTLNFAVKSLTKPLPGH